MVDCFDRIAVRMTEIILEPVRLLRESAQLSAVTLRTPSAGRRFAITIAKRFPDGANEPPAYRWSLVEITPGGDPLPDGATGDSPADRHYPQPEEAYWAAVNALCEETKSAARTSWLLESAHRMVGAERD
ncbi:MAG: hypothetical protein QM589_07885 [Thermomicrobiales bacterium]